MGIDVNLYVIGDVSDEDFAKAEDYLGERVGHHRWEKGAPLIERVERETDRIEFNTLSRYYGPGYERGDWPDIYGAIVAMRGAFPTRRVFYGGDTDDHGYEVTDEFLTSIWAHWLGPDGNAYRRRWAERERQWQGGES